MIRQTWALIVDAYRDLNARKIFWIVMVLSILVAGIFAALGVGPSGLTIVGKQLEWGPNSNEIPPATFYKSILFMDLGLHWWLGVFATILALLSTSGIFPDLLSSGAIDLYLSKPISRWRLFITKYFCGLLFVALQISGFCLACFFVIGIRAGSWEPSLFLSVPIMVLFYSYLYCICTLIGVLTRSTIAAILLTMLFWGAVWGIHLTENMLLLFQLTNHKIAIHLDQRIAADEAALKRLETPAARAGNAAPQSVAASEPSTRSSSFLPGFLSGIKTDWAQSGERTRLNNRLSTERAERAEFRERLVPWHRAFYAIMTVLPKTTETVELLRRQLISRAHIQTMPGSDDEDAPGRDYSPNGPQQPDVRDFAAEIESRSVKWVVGTSVGFELVVLSLAGWLFCRRDY